MDSPATELTGNKSTAMSTTCNAAEITWRLDIRQHMQSPVHYRQQCTSRQRVKYQHKLLTQVADKIYHFYSNSNIFGYHSCNMFKKTNKMDIDRQKHCKPIVCYLGNAFIAVPITIWNVVKFRLHKTIFTTTMTFWRQNIKKNKYQ